MKAVIRKGGIQSAYEEFSKDISLKAVVLRDKEELFELSENEKDLNKKAKIGTWVTFNDAESLNKSLVELDNDGIRTTNTLCIIGNATEVLEKIKKL